MNYTPITDPNATPQYGQSGEAVKTLQNKLNSDNANKPGYVPLKVDGLYGPKTRAVAQPSSLITTSAGIRSGMVKDSTELNNALALFNIPGGSNTPVDTSRGTDTPAVTDPTLSLLDKLSARSNDSTKALISSIQAAKQRQTNAVNDKYGKYKEGLQLMGIQHNEAQSAPELLAGHIQQAETEHLQKLQDIDAATSKALMDAETARDNNDYKTLSAKISYMKELKAEKAATLKSYYDSITQQPKIAGDIAHAIYSEMSKLGPDDKEAFIQAVAKNYKLPLGALVTALNDEHGKQVITNAKVTKAAGGGSSGKNSSGKVTTAQVTYGQKKLDKARGEDGFVDPYLYLQAFKDWPGTVKQFITSFPANGKGGYINPKSYNLLPESIRPKASASKSSSRKS